MSTITQILSTPIRVKSRTEKMRVKNRSPIAVAYMFVFCSPIDVQLTPSQVKSCVPCSNSIDRAEKFLCAINSEPRDRNGTNIQTSLLFDGVRLPASECRGTK